MVVQHRRKQIRPQFYAPSDSGGGWIRTSRTGKLVILPDGGDMPHEQVYKRRRIAPWRPNQERRMNERNDRALAAFEDELLGVDTLASKIEAMEAMTERWFEGWTAIYHDEFPPVPRDGWGEGPWDGEGDYVYWVDPTTECRCVARRGYLGAWCGYVGVPEGHLAHGKDFADVPVSAHAGLTFSREDAQDGWWWFGFDCANSFDMQPGLAATMRLLDVELLRDTSPYAGEMRQRLMNIGNYRDLPYVRNEIGGLAAQLAEIDR